MNSSTGDDDDKPTLPANEKQQNSVIPTTNQQESIDVDKPSNQRMLGIVNVSLFGRPTAVAFYRPRQLKQQQQLQHPSKKPSLNQPMHNYD